MFEVEARTILPLNRLIITSVWVRGDLGNIEVFQSQTTGCPGIAEKRQLLVKGSRWTSVYRAPHASSINKLVELVLSKPIVIPVGNKVTALLPIFA